MFYFDKQEIRYAVRLVAIRFACCQHLQVLNTFNNNINNNNANNLRRDLSKISIREFKRDLKYKVLKF